MSLIGYVHGYYAQTVNASQPMFPLRRELLQTTGRVNYNAQPSWSQNADDLPCKRHFFSHNSLQFLLATAEHMIHTHKIEMANLIFFMVNSRKLPRHKQIYLNKYSKYYFGKKNYIISSNLGSSSALHEFTIKYIKFKTLHMCLTISRSNYSLASIFLLLKVNDKPTVRFFYNMGVEYFKYLSSVYGFDVVKSMANGDYFCEPTAADIDPQMFSDFQHMQLEAAEPDVNSQGKGGVSSTVYLIF